MYYQIPYRFIQGHRYFSAEGRKNHRINQERRCNVSKSANINRVQMKYLLPLHKT